MKIGKPVKRILQSVNVNSIEVFLALLCFLAGLPILLNPAVFAPTSVLTLFSTPFVVLWALALVVGGLLDLVGIMSGNVYLRRSGLIILAAASFVMGVSVIVLTGVTRLFAAGGYFIFSWATGTRYLHLGKTLKYKRRKWERKIRE